jgi:hypothetical protein
MRKMYLFTLISLCIISCERTDHFNHDPDEIRSQVWVPVYMPLNNNVTEVTIQDKQPTENAGKIYAYRNYILQNEQYKGFHIIDNSNPGDPQKVGFLKVPFSTEIAIKNNYLYTNSVSDLLVININNVMQPTLIKKIPNTFPLTNQEHPPISGVYFECVDKSKGIVVNWELKTNMKATCRR